MTDTDDATQAARILHEDQISPTVANARKTIASKQWALFHARDYLLGALQLLDAAHLLRDPQQEEETEQRTRATLTEVRARERAYKRLAYLAAECLPATYRAQLDRIATVRTEDDLNTPTGLTKLDVAAWAHNDSAPDALALARVRRLASDTWKRKTIPRAALLAALDQPNPDV